MLRIWVLNLAATARKIFSAFFGINKGDEKKEMAEKVAKTASKISAYWLTDYALTALTPITIALLKHWGCSDSCTTLVVWIEDILIAYGFVLFSRYVVEDFTVTEALRRTVEAVGSKNRIVGFLLSAALLIRFSLWDGPERIVIFFHKELQGKRAMEFMILVASSALQALFWTKVYILGFGWILKIWNLIF